MTDPDPPASRPDPAPTEQPPTGESLVVVECIVPAAAFALADTLREVPSLHVEWERVVPTNEGALPHLWVYDGETAAFERAVATDASAATAERVAAFDGSALYRVVWDHSPGDILQWCIDQGDAATLLEAAGHGDDWTVTLRLRSRDLLAEFRAFYEERGIDVQILRIYDPAAAEVGRRYDVTCKQRTALVTALKMGYFDIPRECTLDELAAALDISPKSASERLRRGHANLVTNTLAADGSVPIDEGEQRRSGSHPP